MNSIKKQIHESMLREQIEQYVKLFPRFSLYAETLASVLRAASKKYAPLAIVQARPKEISSFAEKILRKDRYKDPVNEITDLCGARVIAHTLDEVKAMCDFIKSNFEIDKANSLEYEQRLKPTEFGYRSVHYIVQFKKGVFPNKEVNVKIPYEVLGLKAEIQVRTTLEHAWADYNHDLSYKGAFKIPQKWERELAGLAASLEAADLTFSRIHADLQNYASSYSSYMSEDEIRDEIELLEIILGFDCENIELAHRIGKLAIVLGDWQKAIDTLKRHEGSGYSPLMRDLGIAYCKKNKDDPKSQEYLDGLKYLKDVCELPNRDIDALCSLAGAYRRGENEKDALERYRQAFEIDPTNPYPLGNYLEMEIQRSKDMSQLEVASPLIKAAIKRCSNQADVGMNLPWAFYDMGKFYLLLQKPYLSLASYCKAIQISPKDWMLQTSLDSIDRLSEISSQIVGYEWVRRILLVGIAAKFPTGDCGIAALEQLRKLHSTKRAPIKSPVVIVVGGCDSTVQQKMQTYRSLILGSFKEFKGTVISGGTSAGIAGLVGELQQKYSIAVRTIGYIPKRAATEKLIDKRYSEIRQTAGEDFSPMEAIQYWIDLIASGIKPSDVRVIGINGGAISAFEYRFALALGARVAIVQDSGRAAADLFNDNDWISSEGLIQVPNDTGTIDEFIGHGSNKLEPGIRETIAKAIHANYRAIQISEGCSQDPSLKKWGDLLDYLKESNRQQADYIAEQLHQIGCVICKVDREVALMKFTVEEIEHMAEKEHARWNIERLLGGWKWGATKDVTKKISPYLVPYDELSEDVKEWDRVAVRKIPEFLSNSGFEVRRLDTENEGLT
jgi:ppGpp synthetase/RelA/SpoT-type nucleotidyltranferase